MKSFLNRKVKLAFGFAMLTLLLMGSLSYRGIDISAESDRWVRHSHEVLSTLQDLAIAMESIESSTRGFVLTGQESDLGAYRANVARVQQDQAAVRALTVDNPSQQLHFPYLEVLTAERIQRADNIVSLRRDQGFAAAGASIGTGSDERDTQFQTLLGTMENEELRLSTLRIAANERDLNQTRMILIFGTLLGICISGVAAWAALRDSAKRSVAEEELRQGEERYRLLLDGIQDYAIFMLDAEGKVVSWNAGAERVKGYTSQQILGQNFARFFPQEDVSQGKPREILRIAADSGQFSELGTRVRKDGSEFLAEVTDAALRDAHGNLRGFSVISHDLTTRQESEARYRGLLEAAPDGMVVVNQAGEIVLLNAQAENQFGYRRDELIGQKVTNIIPVGFAERLIADGTRTAAEALAQQIGTGIELIALRKDGSEFPIEIMLSPLESAEGILVTAAIRNITVRKDAETHLAQMEGRYRGLLEAAPDGMVVVNQAGEIVLLNLQAEKQFGYLRDELIGQKVTNIIPVGFAERLIADGTRTAAEALAQQIGTGIELIALRKDGSEFPIEIMLSPLESAEGILVTAAIRNITVRKDAEKHLVQMEARYRGLLEAAPDAMVVVNQAGEIVLLNAQAEVQFGHRRDELIGQRVTDIIPEGFAERLIADGTRTAAEALSQQIGTGIELVGSRKDGSEFPIEIMLSPLESAEGTLVTVAIRNITTRKDLEKRVEERTKAIAQQSRNFNTTIASIVDHAFMFDSKGRFVYANQALLDLLERTLEEIVGKTCFELPYSHELAERIQRQIQEVVSTGQKIVDVTHYVSPSGVSLYSEYFLSPMIDAEGAVEFVAGGGFDITKRKIAEVHLAQMEGRYRGLLEAAPDGMVVVNQAGEIVLLNAQAENQFRYRRDELIGQRVTNIIPEGFAERLIADGTRTAAEALAQQIGMGIELIGLRKDGSKFPIEIMLSPLESAEGILVTAAIRNITVRKDAETHLAQMEGRYRGLLEAAPDGMVVVNQAGEIVLLNAQAENQFGYRRDELIGQKVTNIIPVGFAERLIADGTRTAAEALAQQIGTGIELIALRKDGSEFPIEIMLSPLKSPEGVLVTAAIRDISERKQLARQLHQSQKMEAVGQLTGGIAHDFNNLLGVIIGNLDLLDRLVAGNAAAAKRVQTAQKAATRGAEITRRLLVFSSNEELKPSRVLLGDSIQNMIELARHGLGPNIKITTHIDESVPPLFIDPAGLESALLNLVVNARDAMPKGGAIIVASHAQDLDATHPAVVTGDLKAGTYVCIAVTDTGQGMTRQTMERAFEPFFTTKPRDKGTGLGLAMVYGFVKQSGGTVRVYSKIDHGTTVSFYLPIDGILQQPVSADSPKLLNAAVGCTVLVVDDEEDLLEIALAYLQEMGLTAFEAPDGKTALEILAQHPEIDLLVTDIVMPGGMNGVELVQQVRALRPDLKIIYSSGFPAEALAERSMSLVDGPLLHKPYQSSEFTAIIHKVMERDYASAEK